MFNEKMKYELSQLHEAQCFFFHRFKGVARKQWGPHQNAFIMLLPCFIRRLSFLKQTLYNVILSLKQRFHHKGKTSNKHKAYIL